MNTVRVIGAGLAGCEAALQIANTGIKVELYEMKPFKKSPAHRTDGFAELVCSNSLKAERLSSAAGLLKEEMRRLNSISLKAADVSRVPAGGALAVDRDKFSEFITNSVKQNKNIEIRCEIVEKIDTSVPTVICTGPLTDGKLAQYISGICEEDNLSFFDAAAPIVTAESIDFDRAFFAARYGNGTPDYINCPMNKEEYEAFYNELINAETAELHGFEKDITVYEGCMPIEILAKRGNDSIRFGPMKPVGLTDPKTGHRPWAVVQLRSENSSNSLYNLVGFQTNLKFGEQKRVFSMIPGLNNAEFVRYGVMHRNSFINSPLLLNKNLSLIKFPNIFFGGQISGVEGYMESAASGIVAGINAAKLIMGEKPMILPEFTMIGALIAYITDRTVTKFQPMGANFGILPPLEESIKDKKERYTALSNRSLKWFDDRIG